MAISRTTVPVPSEAEIISELFFSLLIAALVFWIFPERISVRAFGNPRRIGNLVLPPQAGMRPNWTSGRPT